MTQAGDGGPELTQGSTYLSKPILLSRPRQRAICRMEKELRALAVGPCWHKGYLGELGEQGACFFGTVAAKHENKGPDKVKSNCQPSATPDGGWSHRLAKRTCQAAEAIHPSRVFPGSFPSDNMREPGCPWSSQFKSVITVPGSHNEETMPQAHWHYCTTPCPAALAHVFPIDDQQHSTLPAENSLGLAGPGQPQPPPREI